MNKKCVSVICMQVMHVANRSQTKMIYIHSRLRVQFDESAAQLNQTHVKNGTTKCSTQKKTEPWNLVTQQKCFN